MNDLDLPLDDAGRDVDSVFLERIMRYLDNSLSAEAAGEFREQLVGDPRKREVFARVCLVDTLSRERLAIQNADLIALDDDEPDTSLARKGTGSFDDAIAFPAIRPDPDPPREQPVVIVSPAEETAAPRSPWRKRLRRWGFAAAILLALGTIIELVRPGPPAATIEALSDAHWEGKVASALKPNTPVPTGRSLSLVQGCAALRFAGGTQVIVEAPAHFKIESARAMSLADGRVAVKMAPGETRFTITTPSAVVTDLGTEFGVSYDETTSGTEVHVFEGRVRVGAGGADASAAREVDSGDAARVAHGTIALGPHQASPQTFVRSLAPNTESLELADIVSGGDGTTHLRGGQIDLASGQTQGVGRKSHTAKTAAYHRVPTIPEIDGCLIPIGGVEPEVVDSAGHAFLFPATDKTVYTRIVGGGPIPMGPGQFPIGTKINGIDYAGAFHSHILVHSNAALTFDLLAIGRSHPGSRLSRFRCVLGDSFDMNNPDRDKAILSRSDAYVLVDGAPRFEKRGLRIADGAIEVDVALTNVDRFLTLASTDGGDGQGFDDVLFGDPIIEIAPR